MDELAGLDQLMHRAERIGERDVAANRPVGGLVVENRDTEPSKARSFRFDIGYAKGNRGTGPCGVALGRARSFTAEDDQPKVAALQFEMLGSFGRDGEPQNLLVEAPRQRQVRRKHQETVETGLAHLGARCRPNGLAFSGVRQPGTAVETP